MVEPTEQLSSFHSDNIVTNDNFTMIHEISDSVEVKNVFSIDFEDQSVDESLDSTFAPDFYRKYGNLNNSLNQQQKTVIKKLISELGSTSKHAEDSSDLYFKVADISFANNIHYSDKENNIDNMPSTILESNHNSVLENIPTSNSKSNLKTKYFDEIQKNLVLDKSLNKSEKNIICSMRQNRQHYYKTYSKRNQNSNQKNLNPIYNQCETKKLVCKNSSKTQEDEGNRANNIIPDVMDILYEDPYHLNKHPIEIYMNKINNHENLGYYPQFFLSTLGISNPEKLKADWKGQLNVISCDFYDFKKKRIIFVGNTYCISCQEPKKKCDCPYFKNRTGLCQKCGKIIKNVNKHVSMCNNFRETCKKCNAVFSSASTYKSHLKRTSDAPVCNYFQCKVCAVKFTRADFVRHIEVHPNHLCPKCGKSFVKADNLCSHLKYYHDPKKVTWKPKIVCPICGKIFTKGNSMNRHIMTHTEEKREICKFCNRKYLFKSELKSHIKISHTNQTFACHICNKLFVNSSILHSHIKAAHIKKPLLTCDICKIDFARHNDYRAHLRNMHYKKRTYTKRNIENTKRIKKYRKLKPQGPFICSICKKILKDRDSMRIHYKHHFTLRYKCRKCHMTFSDTKSRLRHEVLHENSRYKFSCKICFSRNNSEAELKTHMQKSHTKEPKQTYQCYHCNEIFSRKYLLLHHMESMHLQINRKDINNIVKALMDQTSIYLEP